MDYIQVIILVRQSYRLNLTKVKLKIIPDPEMYIFFGKCTRVGVSYISNRYSKVFEILRLKVRIKTYFTLRCE